MASLVFRPLTQWPADRPRTPESERKSSPFRGKMGRITPLTTTLDDLDLELHQLGVETAVLQVDVLSARQLRVDGFIRADARVRSPAVVLTFEKPVVGSLRDVPITFACDAFESWQDNLRAIALGMESLRRVDRYKITAAGQQYRGFAALPSSTTPALSTEAAADAIAARAPGFARADILRSADVARTAYRTARANAHPDTQRGGTTHTFTLVQEAARVLGVHHGVSL